MKTRDEAERECAHEMLDLLRVDHVWLAYSGSFDVIGVFDARGPALRACGGRNSFVCMVLLNENIGHIRYRQHLNSEAVD